MSASLTSSGQTIAAQTVVHCGEEYRIDIIDSRALAHLCAKAAGNKNGSCQEGGGAFKITRLGKLAPGV